MVHAAEEMGQGHGEPYAHWSLFKKGESHSLQSLVQMLDGRLKKAKNNLGLRRASIPLHDTLGDEMVQFLVLG